jgi:hypothetical protein
MLINFFSHDLLNMHLLKNEAHECDESCFVLLFQCDVAWYVVMLVTSLFMFFWFYFWLMAENSWNNINWYVTRVITHCISRIFIETP